jgi:hypothetical protein
MSVADVLMVVIMTGIGLSVVYLVAEYSRWRRHEAAEQRKAADFRMLQAEELSRRERDVFESRVVAPAAGATAEAVNDRVAAR